MAAKPRAGEAKCPKLRGWEKLGFRQRNIERQTRVPLAQNKPVSLFVLWIFGVVIQSSSEIQRRQDFYKRESGRYMASSAGVSRFKDIPPQQIRNFS
jgi:hypothetical protein